MVLYDAMVCMYLVARSLLNESLLLQGFHRFIEVFLHRGELHAKVLQRLVGVLVTLLWRIYLVLTSVQVSEGLDCHCPKMPT